jgi:hypothetical protein
MRHFLRLWLSFIPPFIFATSLLSQSLTSGEKQVQYVPNPGQ